MPDGTWVICDDKRFWVDRPAFLQSPAFCRPLLDPGNAAHTRQLLAGAIAAGWASRPSGGHGGTGQGQSFPEYVYGLASAYQTTHATPPIMRHAAARLRASGDAATGRHLSKAADEEVGHDRLALKDLEALRIRSTEFVNGVRPRLALEMVALVESFSQSPSPISVLGYVYAVERLSLFKTQETIDAIEAIVPPGTRATRCLRVHSAVGSDAGHVAKAVDVIARLSPPDRIAVIHAAFETAACMTAPTDYPGDEAVSELLSRYGR